MSRGLSGSVSGTVPREMSHSPISPARMQRTWWPGRDLAELGHVLLAGVDHVLAPVVEPAAVRARAGRRRPAGDAAQCAGLAQVRDRVEQRPRVGVRRRGEDGLAGAELGDLAGVHDGDPVGDVGDHREVVGDVERGDTVRAAQLPHGLQHHALRGDVETGGRLVEHQHLRLRQERHRQRDPLHLATGELVGVAAQELVVVGQADLGQAVARSLESRLGRAQAAELHQLDDLLADPDARVERRGRVLGHVGDLLAPELAHLLPRQARARRCPGRGPCRARSGRRRACSRAARCRRWSCRSRTRRPGRRPRRA